MYTDRAKLLRNSDLETGIAKFVSNEKIMWIYLYIYIPSGPSGKKYIDKDIDVSILHIIYTHTNR